MPGELPEGKVYADPTDPEYHLVHGRHGGPDGWQYRAVCGKNVLAYDLTFGSFFMQLTAWDLEHDWLVPHTACPRCFPPEPTPEER